MIVACSRYFSLLYRRSSRFYVDVAVCMVFVSTFLVETGKDFDSTFLALGVFTTCYFALMVVRQFDLKFQLEAVPVVAREAGRRGAFWGPLLALAGYISIFYLIALILSLMDPGVRRDGGVLRAIR